MKKIAILSSLLLGAVASSHAISLSGTAATSVTNLDGGDSSFVIVDTTGGDTLTSSFFTAGLTLQSGTSLGDYYVAAYNAVVSGGFGDSVTGNAVFNLGDGSTSAGDTYYVVAFDTNIGDNITLTAGNTFGLLSGTDWQLDANNGGSFDYGTNMEQFGTINGAAFTVVPEPSAYAAIAGVLVLGFTAVRRRRRA